MDIHKVNLKVPDVKKAKYLVIALILLVCAAGYALTAKNSADDGILVTRNTQDAELSSVSDEEKTAETKQTEKAETPEGEDQAKQRTSEGKPEYIYVDVSGAVNSPMVVCIPFGSRVFEAIDAAGGRNSESSVKYLNLASVCEDGQKIYVPTKSETDAAEEAGRAMPIQTDDPAVTGESQSEGSTQTTEESENSSSGGKVNLNTAGSEELQSLPGVGPAIASRIIDYRNTRGSFKSVDEIREVSGIGEKIYEKLKDEICV